MNTTMTVQEAQAYLMADPCNNKISATYCGEKRRFFYNSDKGLFGMYNKRSNRRGTIFYNWSSLINIQKFVRGERPYNGALTVKFMKKAAKASFTNNFIRACLAADPTKNPCENHLTMGCYNDGDIITLDSIAKEYPWAASMFRRHLAERTKFSWGRLPFRGYDMTMRIYIDEETNEPYGYLDMEYKDFANGHYYRLINDNEFIYVDKD